MVEKGAAKQILEKYKPEPQFCPNKNGSPIGFDSCFTAFLVLCGGMIFGGIFLVIEMLSKICGYDLSMLY